VNNPDLCEASACDTLCGCSQVGEGGSGVCHSTRRPCNDVKECDASDDCPEGQVCVANSCCTGKPRYCARVCH
jgi:hypothetical protein